jgi:hypothetical protein
MDTNTTTTTKTRKMSPEQIERMVRGAHETRAVRKYLEALSEVPRNRGAYGRPLDKSKATSRLREIEKLLSANLPVMKRLELLAKKRKLQMLLAQADNLEGFEALQNDFIKVAKSYSDRHHLDREVWKEMRVPVKVLDAAGIRR